MRLHRLQLSNFRSHEALDLDLDAIACAAVVGRNGAGKSSLLAALAWCLYGEGKADSLLRHGSAEGHVILHFAHGGHEWKVTRGRERDKRSWLNVLIDEQPSGHHTIAETQGWLIEQLGLDYGAFSASVYAPQGHAGVLADLSPGDRKALIGSLVGLDHYEDWRSEAADRARRAVAEAEASGRTHDALQLRVERETQEVPDEEALAARVAHLQKAREAIEEQLRKARTIATVREQVARRRSLESQGDSLAKEAKAIVDHRERLSQLADVDAEATREQLRLATVALREEHAACQAWEGEHRELERASEGLKERLNQAIERSNALVEREADAEVEYGRVRDELAALEDAPVCPTCEQPVGGDHLGKVRRALRARRDTVRGQRRELGEQVGACRPEIESCRRALHEALEAVNGHGGRPPAPDEGPVRELQAAHEVAVKVAAERDSIRAWLDNFAPKGAEVDEFAEKRQRYEDLKAEWEALPMVVDEAGPSEEHAAEALRKTDEEIAGLQASIARAQAQHERLLEANNELEALADELRDLERRRDVAQVLTRAFGRDGIPALILDGVVGSIESAANELLSELGSGFSVRLATQVEKRSGKGMKETLDILVDTGLAESPIEDLSGGERYRVHIALRLGLAKALSAREWGILLLDEPTDLDEEGMATLAQTLLAMPDRQVLLISHDRSLADALPQQVIVSRRSDVSASEVEVG